MSEHLKDVGMVKLTFNDVDAFLELSAHNHEPLLA
jgi:hypothetical protein